MRFTTGAKNVVSGCVNTLFYLVLSGETDFLGERDLVTRPSFLSPLFSLLDNSVLLLLINFASFSGDFISFPKHVVVGVFFLLGELK